MSQTYVAVLIVIITQLFPTITSVELNTTITTLVTIGSGIWILFRRYQAGGINIFGARK